MAECETVEEIVVVRSGVSEHGNKALRVITPQRLKHRPFLEQAGINGVFKPEPEETFVGIRVVFIAGEGRKQFCKLRVIIITVYSADYAV